MLNELMKGRLGCIVRRHVFSTYHIVVCFSFNCHIAGHAVNKKNPSISSIILSPYTWNHQVPGTQPRFRGMEHNKNKIMSKTQIWGKLPFKDENYVRSV
jgi:hypothetical protein